MFLTFIEGGLRRPVLSRLQPASLRGLLLRSKTVAGHLIGEDPYLTDLRAGDTDSSLADFSW